jgi:hypothetical protein
MPAGKASLNDSADSAAVRGLLIVIVNVDGPPAVIAAGAKAFAMVGCGWTVSVAFAAAPVPALLVVTAPVVLLYVLALALVTSMETVQLPPAGMAPLVSATDAPPGAAITVPPLQDVLAFIEEALIIPTG